MPRCHSRPLCPFDPGILDRIIADQITYLIVTAIDGQGEAVSGIVIMRQGQNAFDVIGCVKKRIREIEPGLPSGVKIVPIYDRSDLIRRSIDNLQSTLVEVILTVALVILVFLWHVPSTAIPVITIPSPSSSHSSPSACWASQPTSYPSAA